LNGASRDAPYELVLDFVYLPEQFVPAFVVSSLAELVALGR